MEKREFLEKLQLALRGKVSQAVLSDTIAYYEEYINNEVRLGRAEAEVMDFLGDPRLIARTIVETKGGGGEEAYVGPGGEDETVGKALRIPGWVWLVVLLVVAVLVVSAVFRLIKVFAPVILVMAAVLFLVKFFRDWMN